MYWKAHSYLYFCHHLITHMVPFVIKIVICRLILTKSSWRWDLRSFLSIASSLEVLGLLFRFRRAWAVRDKEANIWLALQLFLRGSSCLPSVHWIVSIFAARYHPSLRQRLQRPHFHSQLATIDKPISPLVTRFSTYLISTITMISHLAVISTF